jgi:hypothetical protein
MNNSSLKRNKKERERQEGRHQEDGWKKIQTHIALLTSKHKPNNLQLQTTNYKLHVFFNLKRTLENTKHT